MKKELIIVDEEFKNEVTQLKSLCNKAEQALNFLILHLKHTSGHLSGNTEENLKVLIENIESLKDNYSEIGEECKKSFETFIEKIDVADSWLYESEA